MTEPARLAAARDHGRGLINGQEGVTGIAVRRGWGEPVTMTRGVGGAGSGVKTVVGATRGAFGSYGRGVPMVIGPPNDTLSVLVRPSQATYAPRQRARGPMASSAGSPGTAGRATHVRSPRRAETVPSAPTSMRSAMRATSATGATTRPSRSDAEGTLGTNEPSTITVTSAASATGRG